MIDIIISENIQGAAVAALQSRFKVVTQPDLWKDPLLLAEKAKNCRALIVRNQTPVTASLIDASAELVVIGRAGVGLDNVDYKHAEQAGIVVSYTPDQNAISVAEIAIGMMLSLARYIPAADADTKKGNWNRQRFVGTELYGKTLGIVGAGKIGYLTARRATAFGMKILAYDPFLSQDNILLSEIQAELVELDDLLSRADVVSCHLPSTPQTVGLLNRERLFRMKPGALFINTSRGKVVVESGLLEALKAGIVGGVALDVREKEPPQIGKLEKLPNVVLLPHIAAFTHEAQDRVTSAICEDVARVLDGKPAVNAVRRTTPMPRVTS
ncbi:(S)-sulfolactate dehydrogenase [Candidatus Sulfotelmatomonas gaucii]|uniref:(S)-sulfolactate dehydrogenase n=1 Tax=Candidatus Sulfuritelmatomonas gaucii TaxID=2043161 RepID=A0A2N9LCM8_9BACT|nr:(S)-sulfolactate dehydrogenase [Candidatus Sulfotelmatomonas gaucii]